MKVQVMDWLPSVPLHLLQRAYRARNEYAWSRNDAIQVVEALTGGNFKVIGVDIWLPTNPGPTIPTPYVYDWSLGAVDHPRVATEFIRNFDWATDDVSHLGMEPYFNLTVVATGA
jgi:hypothetical protein